MIMALAIGAAIGTSVLFILAVLIAILAILFMDDATVNWEELWMCTLFCAIGGAAINFTITYW